MSEAATQLVIRGGEHEHTRGIAGVYRGDFPGGLQLGYETMRLQDIFVAMLKQRCFEVCEFSLANYIVLRAGGQDWLSAIPVFPFRAFRHGGAITRRESTLTDLTQLAGKRVGVEDYSMTAAVWFRGLLQDEYGVDHRSIRWVSRADQRLPIPTQASVELIEGDLEDQLVAGGIDAMLGFTVRDARLPQRERRLRCVLADPAVAEQDYYARTGIFPINHCIVIRADTLAAHPALPGVLYGAYAAAQARALARPGVTLAPWGDAQRERARELFGANPLPYGLTLSNRMIVERLAHYLCEQGFIQAAPRVDDLFAPV
ncbi:MAG: hypothetical protein FJY56_19920 [Betaproteobacteria bacterium]|nr:hypothetical protein [Betaproteobacteria bacterium]